MEYLYCTCTRGARRFVWLLSWDSNPLHFGSATGKGSQTPVDRQKAVVPLRVSMVGGSAQDPSRWDRA